MPRVHRMTCDQAISCAALTFRVQSFLDSKARVAFDIDDTLLQTTNTAPSGPLHDQVASVQQFLVDVVRSYGLDRVVLITARPTTSRALTLASLVGLSRLNVAWERVAMAFLPQEIASQQNNEAAICEWKTAQRAKYHAVVSVGDKWSDLNCLQREMNVYAGDAYFYVENTEPGYGAGVKLCEKF